jgi:hypothetical protein
MAMVVIMSSHSPNVPIRKMNAAYKMPEKTDLKYHPNKKMAIMNSHHGIQIKKSWMALMNLDDTKKMKSKNPENEESRKATNSSAYFPMCVRISGNPSIINDLAFLVLK